MQRESQLKPALRKGNPQNRRGTIRQELNQPMPFEKENVMKIEIEGREVSTAKNYLDPVTYVPSHANGNAGHPDCEPGVIIRVHTTHMGQVQSVSVLYCKTRTVQATNPSDLVWG